MSDIKNDKRVIKLQGEVLEVLTGSEYRVNIHIDESKTKVITAYAAGKLANNKIRVLEGDLVDVELDKNTITGHGKGRVVYRHNPTKIKNNNI